MNNNFPTDPMGQLDRFIAALCTDWLEAGTVTRVTPRADAVREISRQINQSTRGPVRANNAPGCDNGD